MKEDDLIELFAKGNLSPMTKRFLSLLISHISKNESGNLSHIDVHVTGEYLSVDIFNEDMATWESSLAQLCAEYSNDEFDEW